MTDHSVHWFSVHCCGFFLSTIAGQQAARSLQHSKAVIRWKKTSSVWGMGSKDYTRRSGHHEDQTIRSHAPNRTSDTGNEFEEEFLLFFQYPF